MQGQKVPVAIVQHDLCNKDPTFPAAPAELEPICRKAASLAAASHSAAGSPQN